MKTKITFGTKYMAAALAAALCALGAVSPLAAADIAPPPELRQISACVFFENNSAADIFIEVTVDEALCEKVWGGFLPYLGTFGVEKGERIKTELFVIGVDNTVFCTPNTLITSIAFYNLATGASLGTLTTASAPFQDAADLSPWGEAEVLYYRLTIDDTFLGGLQ